MLAAPAAPAAPAGQAGFAALGPAAPAVIDLDLDSDSERGPVSAESARAYGCYSSSGVL